MNILFVTPNASGTGEAITALDMGRELARSGHSVRYFTDPFHTRVLTESFGSGVDEIPDDPSETEARWHGILSSFQPTVIVFADYPLLALSERGRSLLRLLGPEEADRLDADLITLDHLGMAQGPFRLSFGPPHLEMFAHQIPALPSRMKTLLPCPMQSPGPPSAGRGLPFRQYPVPLSIDESQRRDVKSRFLQQEDELLVFHSTPTWAIEFCRHHGLPNYSYLTRLLETFFGNLPRPVTVVSVNGGSLLKPSSVPALRLINLSRITPSEYDAILLAADLMITDNRISSTLGKAVCGLVPCAAFRNSHRLLDLLDHADSGAKELAMDIEREHIGSVFPFEVFPIWTRDDIDTLGLFADNPIEDCIRMVELYGGAETRASLECLLVDKATREQMRSRQADYVSQIRDLPAAGEALLSVLD